MLRLSAFLGFVLISCSVMLNAQDSIPAITGNKLVYKFNIKENIDPPIWRKTKMALKDAKRLNADIVFIEMNTYGGRVDIADSMRTAILNFTKPVFVLIQNNAASAGALISIACDSIYMQPGSTIGAATVVDQSGQQVPDKYQSYMRKKMRATAEENNRNPDIAESMVDPDKEVEGVSEKGKVVTFTTNEAIQHGFCEGEVSNIEEALKEAGYENYKIIEQQLTWVDKAIDFLTSTAVSGLLIMVIIMGIYFELQTPGVGFPIIAAIAAAILYFAPLYLEGLAENWEILIFIVGLVLLAVEVFVIPGFGVAGISGIVCVVVGLTFSLVGNVGFDLGTFDGDSIMSAFLTVVVATGTALGLSIVLGYKFLQGQLFAKFVLNMVQSKEEGYVSTDPTEHELVGKTGIAATSLRPSGKVEIEDELYDATAESGYIDKDAKVVVVKYETAQLFVRTNANE